MPFHHDDHGVDEEQPEQRVEVDITLEDDIALVESVVAAYLEHQDDEHLAELRRALEELDAQTDRSDAWSIESARHWNLDRMSLQEAIGQTGPVPHAEVMPASELQGQVTLVKAAKEVVRHPGIQTVATLASARAALEAFRTQA